MRVSDFSTEYVGCDLPIMYISSLDNIVEFSLVFSKEKLTDNILKDVKNVCFIVPELPDILGQNTYIISKNPKLTFAKIVSKYFSGYRCAEIGENNVIHPTAIIGENVIIGNGCIIGRNVTIDDDTEIRHNVVISDNVVIGKGCLIRSNAVIGEEGFSFVYEDDGTPIRMPHLGSVKIGDYVEIGNSTSIARGTINDTIIQSYVKIDNLVHIAHNCNIGEKTMIIACAEISGSTTIGNQCWIGVGSSIIQKTNIVDGCLIGMGAVVLNDIEEQGSVVVGNPSRFLKFKDVNKTEIIKNGNIRNKI